MTEYAAFIAKVREKQEKGIPRDEAIDQTIDECIEENIIHETLLNRLYEEYGLSEQ